MNWERVRRARWWARSLLVIAGLAVAVPVFLGIASPRFLDPTFGPPPPPEVVFLSALVFVIGIGGVIFGLAWMWRIYRAPTQYRDHALWRYRDRD
jgi:hypothetical protein